MLMTSGFAFGQSALYFCCSTSGQDITNTYHTHYMQKFSVLYSEFSLYVHVYLHVYVHVYVCTYMCAHIFLFLICTECRDTDGTEVRGPVQGKVCERSTGVSTVWRGVATGQ